MKQKKSQSLFYTRFSSVLIIANDYVIKDSIIIKDLTKFRQQMGDFAS